MPSAKPHLHAGRKAMRAGRPAMAIAHFARGLAVDPRNVPLIDELGHAFHADGQVVNALKAFDRVITAGRANARTWSATGELCLQVKEYAQALDAFSQALQLDPGLAACHHGLAQGAYMRGDADRADRHFAEAISRDPRRESLISRATMLPNAPGASHQDVLEARRALAGCLATGSLLAGRPRPGPYQHSIPRIGYLSSHFPGENYMKPVWALLNHHDRRAFRIHLFSDHGDEHDSDFPGYRRHEEDHLHQVHALDNRELADLIAEAQIDLLVDLNSYSTPGRLELFLAPPAPVVVAWFNSFATSGLPGIDVLVGDAETIRTEEEEYYSEQIVRLPLSYLTFQVTHEVPPVADPPCLKNGYLTFGSLVTQYKITPPVLEAWSAILREAPEARLVLSNRVLQSSENAAWLVACFAERGVEASRLRFLPPAPHLEFLRYYDQIDLALDAFPYNGGTTTMEAIWQGVPVLTFDGDRWASRTSQTILRRTHLAGFVAPNAAEMIARAVELATAPPAPEFLTGLRREMRAQLAGTQACDGAAFAGAMEELYRQLLER